MEQLNLIVKRSGLFKKISSPTETCRWTCCGLNEAARSVESDALPVFAFSSSREERAAPIACTCVVVWYRFSYWSAIDLWFKLTMFVAFKSPSFSFHPIPQEQDVWQKKTLGLTHSRDTSSVSQPKPSSMPATQFQPSYWCIFGLSPFSIVISCFSLPSISQSTG